MSIFVARAAGPARGMGQSPFNVERDIDSSFPQGGFYEDVQIPLMGGTDWLSGVSFPNSFYPSGAGANTAVGTGNVISAGAPITTTSGSPFSLTTTGARAIRWSQNATTSARAIFSIIVPGQYDAVSDDLKFVLNFGQLGTPGNPTMSLYLWRFRPGQILPTIADTANPSTSTDQIRTATAAEPLYLGTKARKLIALGDATNEQCYTYLYDFKRDTMGRTTSPDQTILPGDHLTLCIAPSGANIAAGNYVDLYGIAMRYRRSASLYNREVRTRSDRVI